MLLCIPIQQPVIRRPIINSDMATFHKLRHRNINSVSHLVKTASDNHFFNNLVGISCYYVFIILLGAACFDFEAAAVRWGGAGGAAAPLHAVCCTSLQCSAAPQRGGGGCQMSNRRNVQMPPTLTPLVRAALCHHGLWAGPGMLELVRHLGPRIQNIYHLSWLWPSYPSSPHRSMALYTSVQCPRCWRGIRRWRGDTAAMGRCAGTLVALVQPSLELPSVSLHNHGGTALNCGGRCWPGNPTPLAPGETWHLCSSARANTSDAAWNNYNIHLTASVPTLRWWLRPNLLLVYVQHVRPGPGGHPGLCWEMLVVKSDQSVGGRHPLPTSWGQANMRIAEAQTLTTKVTKYL